MQGDAYGALPEPRKSVQEEGAVNYTKNCSEWHEHESVGDGPATYTTKG